MNPTNHKLPWIYAVPEFQPEYIHEFNPELITECNPEFNPVVIPESVPDAIDKRTYKQPVRIRP